VPVYTPPAAPAYTPPALAPEPAYSPPAEAPRRLAPETTPAYSSPFG
jgi:hypothetical protein